MTVQEARDDEREALAGIVFARFRMQPWDTVPDHLRDPWRQIADKILAAGYRKHPEPEITEWVATLEALLAEVYTILKPLVAEKSHGTGSPLLRAYGLLDQQDFTHRVPVGEGEHGA